MALSTGLNRSRSAIVFVVNETTPGTIASNPNTNGSERFGLTTTPVIGQSGNYTDTSEIGPELISVDRVLNYMEYSTFDFEFYAKPGGRSTSDIAVDNLSDTVAIATNQVTITVATHSLSIGDTINVAFTGDSVSSGIFTVKSVNGGTTDIVYDCASAPSGVTTVIGNLSTLQKVTMAMPEEHNILNRCLGGVKYMSASHNGYNEGATSGTGVDNTNATVVQYFLSNTIQTMTVTARQFTDDSVQMYTASGSLPTSWSVSLAKDGPVTYSTGFQANRVYYAGTAGLDVTHDGGHGGGVVNGTSGTNSVVKVSSPVRYNNGTTAVADDISWYQSANGAAQFMLKIAGSIVQFDAGGNAIFTVKAANSGNLVTISPDGDLASGGANVTLSGDSFLIPYTPVPCPDTTSILDQRKVQVFTAPEMTGTGLDFVTSSASDLFNSANELDVTAVSWDFDRSISTPALTEMTGEEFPPASYVINEPTVSGSFTLLLRPKDFQLMNSLRAEPHRAFGVRVGSVDGKIIEMAAPSVFMEIPTPADADGATQIDIPFTVVRGQECEDADKFFIRYR